MFRREQLLLGYNMARIARIVQEKFLVLTQYKLLVKGTQIAQNIPNLLP